MSDGIESFYDDAMDLVRSCAIEKNIEFDGYFQQRWKDSADTIINFDEEYFEDPDRRDLYVFLSAMVDDQIFSFVQKVFEFFQDRSFDENGELIPIEQVTKEFVEDKIDYLTKEKGVKF